MAKRSTPRRGRASRKRRAEGGTTATVVPAPPAREERRVARSVRAAPAADERPQAPWHPLPLAELLILVGIVGAIVGASRGESGLPALLAGVGAVLVGTLEFTIREHRSGYRSHAALLAALPTALLHSAIAVGMLALHAPSPSWVLVPLIVDVPVFLALFRTLRKRFQDARRQRTFGARRS